jgi:hypothetical protein
MPFRPLYRNFSKNYYIYNLDLKFWNETDANPCPYN